ncbi:MAG: isocitrate lyase/phosphoenolpyruvate mutase family protein [Pseudomonadota bacterium]
MTADNVSCAYRIFADLHARDRVFVLGNAWDTGSAQMLAGLGYEALGTTSWGAAIVAGRLDGPGQVSRELALGHAQEIVEATDLPVSADLEDGFGALPEDVAETVRQAAAIGLAGCSIEDTTGDPERPIFPLDEAVARISAAVDVVRSIGRPFVLTARAENYSYGRPDLADTLARLKAFEVAGADCLYAPELPNLATVQAVCEAVRKPVNVVSGLGLPDDVTLEMLESVGVRRVSFGSSLMRVGMRAVRDAAQAVLVSGALAPVTDGLDFDEAEALVASGRPRGAASDSARQS